MQWLNENLYDTYSLIGETADGVVKLSLLHPNGEKIIRIKYMRQPDLDNATSDDIKQHFSGIIAKIKAKSKEQLEIYILNRRGIDKRD